MIRQIFKLLSNNELPSLVFTEYLFHDEGLGNSFDCMLLFKLSCGMACD